MLRNVVLTVATMVALAGVAEAAETNFGGTAESYQQRLGSLQLPGGGAGGPRTGPSRGSSARPR